MSQLREYCDHVPIDPFVCFCFSGVGRPPFLGGGQGDEAGRESEGSSPGASLGGPHSHTGEGSVRAGPTTAEKPLQHGATVYQPCKGWVTFELQAERKLLRIVWWKTAAS